ncbi:MAG: response regulator [Bacteroidales bacterium]|nr:response regulator [Bacteroidales bacterium]
MRLRSDIYSIFLLFAILSLGMVQRAYSTAPPQTQALHFRHIDTKGGLPDNSINAIAQDEKGFIWLGTWCGLSHFDGTTHRIFKHSETDSATLINDMVRSLCSAPDGMWIGTDNGLDFYSFADCSFHHCTALGQESDKEASRITTRINQISIVGGRVYVLTIHGRLFVQSEGCVFSPILIEDTSCWAMTQYIHDNLILVTNHGLLVLNTSTNEPVARYDAHINHTRQNCNVHYSGNTGCIYVGNGIGYPSYAFTIDGDNQITPSASFVPVDLMQAIDARGCTYFATDGDALWRIDPTGEVAHIADDNSNLQAPALYSLHTDADQNLWVGSYRRGVWIYADAYNVFHLANKQNGLLTHDIVSSILPYPDGVYVGLDGGGLNITSAFGVKRKEYTSENSRLAGNNVVTMLRDGRKLWMGIYTRGLASLDLETGAVETFTVPNTQYDSNNVWMICDDPRDDQLWICSRTLYTFDKKTHQFQEVEGMQDKICMGCQPQGHYLWVATPTNGIYKIDRNLRKIVAHYNNESQELRLPSNQINVMLVDHQGKVWAGINCFGLCCIDEDAQTCKLLNSEQGLTEKRLTSLTEDQNHVIWIGTERGLFRLNPNEEYVLRIDHPVIPDNFVYNATALRGDTMYLGATEGLVYFNTREVMLKNLPDGPTMLGLKVMSDRPRLIERYDVRPEAIVLRANENFFTAFFAVPQLLQGDRVRYSYRLDGFDSDWHEAGHSPEATYSNLPAGKYSLLVRCAQPSGEWSQASMMPITILPHWYNTWYMRLIWVLLGFGFIFIVFYIYNRTMHIRQRMRIAEIEREAQKEINDAKLDFYAQVTHELRTKAFLISAQIEHLLESPDNVIQTRRPYLTGMLQNSMKLNKMINRIIDLRKMDSGKLKLVCAKMDVVDFISQLNPDYEMLCEQKDIEYTFVHDPRPILMDIDPDKFEMIISNLVSNAFKYTLEQGAITLTVRDLGDRVSIAVKDNGIGIVKEQQQAIFEKYVRTERGQRHTSGDGLGLAVVKELVNLFGGEITLASQPNVGSEFTIILPKRQNEEEEGEEEAKPVTTIDSKEEEELEDFAFNPTAPYTALIVDDDKSVANVLAHALNDDFKVYWARNGAEGLELAAKLKPDCIVTDIMMPKMDGIEMLEHLKNDKATANIRTVVFTAKDSDEAMNKGYDLGVDAWFTKPMSLALLKKHLLTMLSSTETTPPMVKISSTDDGEPQATYTRQEQEFLMQCRQAIDEAVKDPNFSLEMVADKLNMSHSTLYKRIKKLTGMTLLEFVNEYRVWKAIDIIKRGEENVTQVAIICGFRDAKSFRELFKRRMGLSPRAYIQSLHNE